MLQYGAGGNVQKGTSLNTAKLDAETEELKHKTVDLAVGKVGYRLTAFSSNSPPPRVVDPDPH
jgi:hypothetical protein